MGCPNSGGPTDCEVIASGFNSGFARSGFLDDHDKNGDSRIRFVDIDAQVIVGRRFPLECLCVRWNDTTPDLQPRLIKVSRPMIPLIQFLCIYVPTSHRNAMFDCVPLSRTARFLRCFPSAHRFSSRLCHSLRSDLVYGLLHPDEKDQPVCIPVLESVFPIHLMMWPCGEHGS